MNAFPGVRVDQGMPLEELLLLGKYDYANPEINSKNFLTVQRQRLKWRLNSSTGKVMGYLSPKLKGRAEMSKVVKRLQSFFGRSDERNYLMKD